MIGCVWMRTLINFWVYFINIASIVGGIPNALLGNLISKLVVNWFPPTEHVAGTVICALAGLLGSIVGPFYALLFIGDTSGVENVKQARFNVFRALLYMAITYTSIYVICIILYKDKPKHPPGYGLFYSPNPSHIIARKQSNQIKLVRILSGPNLKLCLRTKTF